MVEIKKISDEEFVELCNRQAEAIRACNEKTCGATIDALRIADLAVQVARQQVARSERRKAPAAGRNRTAGTKV